MAELQRQTPGTQPAKKRTKTPKSPFKESEPIWCAISPSNKVMILSAATTSGACLENLKRVYSITPEDAVVKGYTVRPVTMQAFPSDGINEASNDSSTDDDAEGKADVE